MAVNKTKKIKMKNIIFAIEVAPTAISVKPKIAATIAINKNMADHFNMILYFYFSLFTNI